MICWHNMWYIITHWWQWDNNEVEVNRFVCWKITSKHCEILAIVGTLAVNYSIFVMIIITFFAKGHHRSFLELIQLLGRLKQGCGVWLMQDQIHILLSMSNFISVYHFVLQHENEVEYKRKMEELRSVTYILTDRNKYFALVTEQ